MVIERRKTICTLSEEKWLPVAGTGGKYLVSSRGRVMGPRGTILRPAKHVRGYLKVTIRPEGGGRYTENVHRLVARAFIENPLNLPYVCHWDDNPENNAVENLRWGTASDNVNDAVRNGVHPESKVTHCPQGHEYTNENTAISKLRDGWCRKCRKCLNRRSKLWQIKDRDSRLNAQEKGDLKKAERDEALEELKIKQREKEEVF